VIAIDQGTTGSTALVFDESGSAIGRAYVEFPQYFPQPGWVEHDPLEIWHSVERVARAAVQQARQTHADLRLLVAGA
jgi:glycerol kinase